MEPMTVTAFIKAFIWGLLLKLPKLLGGKPSPPAPPPVVNNYYITHSQNVAIGATLTSGGMPPEPPHLEGKQH